jgi:hypothetical protein
MLGARLLSLARHWFDEATSGSVFEPLLADWQRECAGLSGRRRMICWLQGFTAFATAFILTFVSKAHEPAAAGLDFRTWRAAAAFTACGTLVLLLPWVSEMYVEGRWVSRIDLLVPSALVLAVPMAIVPAISLILTDARWHPADARRSAVRFSAFSTLLVLVLGGWLVPMANQQWRVEVSARKGYYSNRPVLRGTRELTLPELAAAGTPTGLLDRAHRDREFHNRLIIITAPIVTTILAFGVARRSRRRLARAAAWWLVTPSIWYATDTMAQLSVRTHHTPVVLWLTPLTFVLLAAALHTAERRRASPELLWTEQ